MQLVEQGKVDLQADFQTYVKGLEFDNPFDKPVTVENLLTHTTGFEIRDPQQEDIHADFDKTVSMEDYAQQHMPPVVRTWQCLYVRQFLIPAARHDCGECQR